MAKIFATKRIENGYHGWNDTGNDGFVDIFGFDIAFGKKVGGKDIKLVFCYTPFSTYPPVFDKMLSIINADYSVCIADIDNKEHKISS
jgi:hypothetical protein